MSERFQTYLQKLEALSSAELDRSVVELVGVENQHVALVIAHLAEISRRKGELERGYKNLFDYCVRRLHLSEGSVALRIQVANVVRRFPQVLASLAEGKISLSVAGLLAPHLSEENVERLLADSAGLTKRAAEEYLVRLSPRAPYAPSIRKRPGAGAEVTGAPQSEERASEEGGPAAEAASRPEAPAALPRARPSAPPGLLTPATPELYNFRFTASAGFKAKLERLSEVLGIENPAKDLAEVLARAVDLALEKKDPAKRLERRRERERRREAAAARSREAAGPRPDETASTEETPQVEPSSPSAGEAPAPAKSRHVPAAVRDRVLARAGHQCEYTGPDGTRCTARSGLQIEHLQPFAIFHSHAEPSLAVLCASHNRLRAEQVYGAERIREKVEARRLERVSVPCEPCRSS